MIIFRKNASRVAAISLIAASIVGASATSAFAAAPVSDGPVYIYSPADGLEFADGFVHTLGHGPRG
jgi:hypothetical protein